LNFGHTLGHAIEAAGGYAEWTHGEAVAIGMAAALRLSAEREGFPAADAAALAEELVRFGGRPAPRWSAELEDAMLRDKKAAAAGLSGVLLRDWGSPVVRKVAPDEWRKSLEGEPFGRGTGGTPPAGA
ncbi:MAG TPA: hypothetical protein VG777_02420, partial [Thermoanaerobaculia bacterium]|nr:hypothetical protein [Thermoanaerobaculia bacterium]